MIVVYDPLVFDVLVSWKKYSLAGAPFLAPSLAEKGVPILAAPAAPELTP
jgi:hypothetical protein